MKVTRELSERDKRAQRNVYFAERLLTQHGFSVAAVNSGYMKTVWILHIVHSTSSTTYVGKCHFGLQFSER